MDPKANLSISWKSVAISAIIAALAALILTAIVATIEKADTLSVVALGVATIAFVIQIIVFIVQAAAASEQSLRAQELYGSTLKVLAAIEEKTEGTSRTVSTINDRMLSALIEKAIPEAVASKGSINSPNFSAEVAERVVGLIAEAPDLRMQLFRESDSRSSEEPLLRGSPKEITFPNGDDVRRILPKIADLAPSDGLFDLRMLGRDWTRYGTDSDLAGIPTVANAKRLHDRGLVRRVRRPWFSASPVFVVSQDGQLAARMLLSKDIPSNVPTELVALREALRVTAIEGAEGDASGEIPIEED